MSDEYDEPRAHALRERRHAACIEIGDATPWRQLDRTLIKLLPEAVLNKQHVEP